MKTEKICCECRILKPLTQFHANRTKSGDGYQYRCKQCRKKYQSNLHKNEEWRNKNRASRRRRLYGFTQEMWDLTWKVQAGCCAICGDSFDKLARTPHADHDHLLETPRGILCNHCNQGVGWFKDDPIICRAAARYLENPTIQHPKEDLL